jgi:hypothetical protein
MILSGGLTFSGGLTVTPQPPPTQKAIFGYGSNGGGNLSMTNLVSDTGVVATDTTGVGTARDGLAAASYGGDKAIFGYGNTGPSYVSITNLVTNTGVVSTDTSGVGTVRTWLGAAGYGTDKAIFGYGYITGGTTSLTNLVSNTGVVGNNVTGVGSSRNGIAAAGYGTDKAIFGFGQLGAPTFVYDAITNLVSNTGVVSTDQAAVTGSGRSYPAAASYGTDKAIFGYGGGNPSITAITNLVSNTGVVASNTTGVGTGRSGPSAAGYGADKAIFGYGLSVSPSVIYQSITNLVSNTGVVATDTTGVGTGRYLLAAASITS